MSKRVVVFGGGGHARVVIEACHMTQEPDVTLVGIIDPNPALWGQAIWGVPILGGDEHLSQLIEEGVNAFVVGVGSVGNPHLRKKMTQVGLSWQLTPLNVIHPTAIYSPYATFGAGVQLLARSVINPAAHLGGHVIINTGAIVEHDCIIGDYTHIATGATLCGAVQVGAETHIGAGAIIRQGIKIGERAIIGAGAVVVKDVSADTTVIGLPAKPVSA